MNYIINKHTSKVYNYYPQTRYELKKLIYKLIKERGNEANLNDIDTSSITLMHDLFRDFNFNGDISNWDVSNVIDMSGMFFNSKFTGENGDISKWDVSNVEYMKFMFAGSKFTCDISGWDVSNVVDMSYMFAYSKVTIDINNWDVSNVKDMSYMFINSPIENSKPAWYVF